MSELETLSGPLEYVGPIDSAEPLTVEQRLSQLDDYLRAFFVIRDRKRVMSAVRRIVFNQEQT
jgi:hypothetical protein